MEHDKAHDNTFRAKSSLSGSNSTNHRKIEKNNEKSTQSSRSERTLASTQSTTSSQREKRSDVSEDDLGESLGGFVEEEWNTSAPAYNPELINVKTEPNKVTVFKARTMVNTREKMETNTPPHISIEKTAILASDFRVTSNLSIPIVSSKVYPDNVSLSTGSGVVGHVSETLPMRHIELGSSEATSQTRLSTADLTVTEAEFSSASANYLKESDDRADRIGALVSDIVRQFLSNKCEQRVQISLELVHEKRMMRPNFTSWHETSNGGAIRNFSHSSPDLSRDVTINSPTFTKSSQQERGRSAKKHLDAVAPAYSKSMRVNSKKTAISDDESSLLKNFDTSSMDLKSVSPQLPDAISCSTFSLGASVPSSLSLSLASSPTSSSFSSSSNTSSASSSSVPTSKSSTINSSASNHITNSSRKNEKNS